MSRLPAAARTFLEPALDPDQDWTWPDIEARVIGKTAQLWLEADAALLTEIIDGCCHVWLGGGRLKTLLTMRPRIEAWARAAGCDRATIIGRKGWDRVFEKCGYVRKGDELEKLL